MSNKELAFAGRINRSIHGELMYFRQSRSMPTVGHIGSFDVMIFRNDHDPPHFHVIGAEFSAKFAIADQEFLSCRGRIRRHDIRLIKNWGQRHQNAIQLNWHLAREGRPPLRMTD